MADVNNTDVRTATNASNTTRYFHLPLFIASDKPSWLVDWNGAMGDIDNILQDIATASEGAVADVATIQTQIDALNATIPNLESLVETAVSDVAAMQTTVDSHETRMDAIEADLITQNNLIKTLSDAVTTMQGSVATLNNRVAAMETTVSGYDTEIDAIQTGLDSVQASLTSLQSTVSGHTSSINSLETRVTALENSGGGGGMPAVGDLINYDNQNFSRSDITTADIGSQVLFTAATDCYVIVTMWLETNVPVNFSPSGNTYHRQIEAHINNETIGSCEFSLALPYGPATVASNIQTHGVTGMYKLKAGDTVSIAKQTYLDPDIAVNFNIHLYH